MVTSDGLPIVCDLPAEMDVEAAAGLGAHVGRMIADWAGEVGLKSASIAMMESNQARLFISSTAWGFLVAVADKRCPLGEARIGMKKAAAQLDSICAGLNSRIMAEEANEGGVGV